MLFLQLKKKCGQLKTLDPGLCDPQPHAARLGPPIMRAFVRRASSDLELLTGGARARNHCFPHSSAFPWAVDSACCAVQGTRVFSVHHQGAGKCLRRFLGSAILGRRVCPSPPVNLPWKQKADLMVIKVKEGREAGKALNLPSPWGELRPHASHSSLFAIWCFGEHLSGLA